MTHAKCPHCDQIVTQVEGLDVPVTVSHRPQWQGLAYACPHCHKILSVQVNPFLLNNELVADLLKALRGY